MRILILGCGWVGQQYAAFALSKGYEVVGTTTRSEKVQELHAMGVQPVLHNLDHDGSLPPSLGSFDYVLNSIPATKKLSVEIVERRFQQIVNMLSQLSFRKHIYLSSIGIYPNITGIFDEVSTPESMLDKILRTAERSVSTVPNTTIFRLGGLFGRDRIFAKFFQDRVCSTGEQLANFIHVADVVQLIEAGFDHPLQHSIYNIVSPHHPGKRSVIEASAAKYGYQLPSAFVPEDTFQKFVDGGLIAAELDYNFRYPSPLDF